MLAQAVPADGEVAVDEAEEAAVDEQLKELRQQIAAAKHTGELAAASGHDRLACDVAAPGCTAAQPRSRATCAGRTLKANIAQYDVALERYGSSLASLQAVPVLAGKENSVGEDSRVLAATAMQLAEQLRQLEDLRQKKGAVERVGQQTDGASLDRPCVAAASRCLGLHSHQRGRGQPLTMLACADGPPVL